ncbi:hypothetical protein BS50DRAFT_9423 [Corynespora cassiicola Philippines]|uniref:F-box domain-containing protein n=1 Tax=Corynespora cassiicola Philippines TaxID=1448308 RepID=A0A2T2P930_CORCC|nr:hypothetical protein BS50DRAFT_9423 [Corynespora cassiicola Philippines]
MSTIEMKSPFLALPAELRVHILSYALIQQPNTGFTRARPKDESSYHGIVLDDSYSSSDHLSILLTCRQFRQDITSQAFKSTSFVITDIYSSLSTLLQPLQPYHISSLRKISFVAGARQFREMVHWYRWPFNMESLRLEELAVVMHRSAHWHYPSDFTTDMVGLLRRLQNVEMLKFVRNAANVKGFFHTWYNRLVGLILKEDHFQRYDAAGAPNIEVTWWEWSFDEGESSFQLDARPPKKVVPEDEYMEFVKPKVERLVKDMEMEEEDPDPRARNGWP